MGTLRSGRRAAHAAVVAFAAAACSGHRDLPAGAPQRAAELPPVLIDYVLHRAPVILLENLRVIDGTGAPPRERQSILVRAGRIAWTGDGADLEPPSEALRLDASGLTALPGLVMVHEHLMGDASTQSKAPAMETASHPTLYSSPRLLLAAGVTTIRTAGTYFPYRDISTRRALGEGRAPGPKIHLTSPLFNGWSENSYLDELIVADAAEARRAVAYWAAEGMTSFKAYTGIPREALRGMIDEAHARGLQATIHPFDCRTAVELGIDSIEHGIYACVEEFREASEAGPPGVSPLETIRMASLDGAAYLDLSDEVGSIAAGKAADLLIVRGNPAERIGDISTVIWVFKDGVAYEP
jgi:imidazolonepropionase-like amidohydrolase